MSTEPTSPVDPTEKIAAMLRYPYLREYVGRISYDEAAEALDALAVRHAEQGEAVAKLVAQLRLLSKLYSKSNAVNKELVAEVDGNLREVIASLSPPAAVPVQSLTEQQKADRDAILYGTGFMLNGKHIPAREVYVVAHPAPQQPAPKPDAVADEPCGCKSFCEHHGREFIEITEDGEEYCHECSADGFSGELCSPMAGSCDMRNPEANEFERSFMCPTHAAEHKAFCRESYAERGKPDAVAVECQWTAADDGMHDYWETGCGLAFCFEDGGSPTANNFMFCHGCGKPISIAAALAQQGKEGGE